MRTFLYFHILDKVFARVHTSRQAGRVSTAARCCEKRSVVFTVFVVVVIVSARRRLMHVNKEEQLSGSVCLRPKMKPSSAKFEHYYCPRSTMRCLRLKVKCIIHVIVAVRLITVFKL